MVKVTPFQIYLIFLPHLIRGDSTENTNECFPENFLIGSATAAYQVEGGWNLTRRTESIWDDFCRTHEDVSCANVADDMLHRYPQDLELMKRMGLETYRFSVSWSRVMTWDEDSKKMVRNQEGIDFYQKMIAEIHREKLIPILTMYHWDLPLKLQTELSPPGWLNLEIVEHFEDYSNLLFKEFGQSINYWATFNEPWTFATNGYGIGVHAPGFSGSMTNEYTVAHNVLLSHAKAVSLFRELQQNTKDIVGEEARISMVLNCDYGFPLNPTNMDDLAAVERKMQFILGWFLEPIVSGDYPPLMKEYVGDRLPTFSTEQSQQLKGSYDLFMLNHYSSQLVTDCDSNSSLVPCDELPLGWYRDLAVDQSRFPQGARLSSINEEGQRNCGWFSGYPKGYYEVIQWMHQTDPDTEILLTENGWCGNSTVDNEDQVWYYDGYLKQVLKAIGEGVPIIGYTAWSFLDNYEWGSFEPRFGLFYINYPNQAGSVEGYIPLKGDLERTPRPAAGLISSIAKSKCFPQDLDASEDLSAFSVSSKRETQRTITLVIILALLLLYAAFYIRRRCYERTYVVIA